jgi:hypothetical protein
LDAVVFPSAPVVVAPVFPSALAAVAVAALDLAFPWPSALACQPVLAGA